MPEILFLLGGKNPTITKFCLYMGCSVINPVWLHRSRFRAYRQDLSCKKAEVQSKVTHLYIAAIDVHAADHAALRGDIGPIDHLFPVVEVQSHSIVQPLNSPREKD